MHAILEAIWKPLACAFRDSRQAKAHAERKHPALGEKPADPQTESVANDPGRISDRAAAEADEDPRLELERRCSDLAYDKARKSWELEPDDQTLKALEAKGQALAQSLHRPPSEANDNRKIAKLQALEVERKKRLAARDRAKAVAQSHYEKFAALGPAPPFPTISGTLLHAATLALAISIAPTFHDLFVGLDSVMKWVAGAGCAWGVSLLIIHGLLPATADQAPRDSEDNEEDKEEKA